MNWADRLAEIAEQGRIEYTTIVTSGLMDLLLTRDMLGFDLQNQRRCSMPEVETKNRRIRVAEVEYTGQDILGELERATGKKWMVENGVRCCDSNWTVMERVP